MARKVRAEETGGEVKLLVVSDTTETDRMNAEERKLGKGFTLGGTMRKIGNIAQGDIEALAALGDKNAREYRESGGMDEMALRRLLRYHPEFRCSEGDI